jgi:hypothetical protein
MMPDDAFKHGTVVMLQHQLLAAIASDCPAPKLQIALRATHGTSLVKAFTRED